MEGFGQDLELNKQSEKKQEAETRQVAQYAEEKGCCYLWSLESGSNELGKSVHG